MCYQDQVQAYFTTPDTKTLLTDDKICQLHPTDCQEAALERLGLPTDSTFKQVKSHWHKLAKQFHPDKLSATDSATQQAEFLHFAQAYERLEKLSTNLKK